MRTIDINISWAKLESFSVNFLDNELPRIDATMWLYTRSGKRISEYRISTKDYYGNETIELSPEIHTHLRKACEILERAAYNKCNWELWLIERPKKNKVVTIEPSLEDVPF